MKFKLLSSLIIGVHGVTTVDRRTISKQLDTKLAIAFESGQRRSINSQFQLEMKIQMQQNHAKQLLLMRYNDTKVSMGAIFSQILDKMGQRVNNAMIIYLSQKSLQGNLLLAGLASLHLIFLFKRRRSTFQLHCLLLGLKNLSIRKHYLTNNL